MGKVVSCWTCLPRSAILQDCCPLYGNHPPMVGGVGKTTRLPKPPFPSFKLCATLVCDHYQIYSMVIQRPSSHLLFHLPIVPPPLSPPLIFTIQWLGLFPLLNSSVLPIIPISWSQPLIAMIQWLRFIPSFLLLLPWNLISLWLSRARKGGRKPSSSIYTVNSSNNSIEQQNGRRTNRTTSSSEEHLSGMEFNP